MSPFPSDFLTTEIRPAIMSSWTVTGLSSATPDNIQSRRSGQERFLYGARGEFIAAYFVCLHRRMFFKRLYHAARLRWNSIERRRTPDDDKLIDDVAEWALW